MSLPYRVVDNQPSKEWDEPLRWQKMVGYPYLAMDRVRLRYVMWLGGKVPFEVLPEMISTNETGLWHHWWLLPRCPEPLAIPCQAMR